MWAESTKKGRKRGGIWKEGREKRKRKKGREN